MDVMFDGNANLHCKPNALVGNFGWFLQALLATLAFLCLIIKRFCEPKYDRRPWKVWFFDTSKQGLGALLMHSANLLLAGQFQDDPCTWYMIHFLLDSSLGLLLIFCGIRFSQHIARVKNWESFNFGEYGKPESIRIWLVQCGLYLTLLLCVKIVITMLISLKIWQVITKFIMYPFTDPITELTIVMLIIPLFINALMFWVTDDILMHRSRHRMGLLRRMKIQYHKVHQNSRLDEVAGSDNEELLNLDETTMILRS
ncbi:store-operated calcium entry regulator STIMATE-like [Daktulosphaira vitifoliae]|uniref:store-operated calcium entry regulator STIMATE-like n=1 Tax=Daktulosphaira vitifoliae TaxID=58002 RepID=UPI0021AAAA37|nr:store-operated calcium entry regulator STIMATE-like [Daktulosphaira vitifoliae]